MFNILMLNLHTVHDFLSSYKSEKCLIDADNTVDIMRDLSEPSRTYFHDPDQNYSPCAQ